MEQIGTSILKAVYIHNEPLHISANHLAECPHGWPNYVGDNYVYKQVSIYLSGFVGDTTVCFLIYLNSCRTSKQKRNVSKTYSMCKK